MYKGVFNIFKRYWLAYGGVKALIRSPYLHLALMLTGLSWSQWLGEEKWWDTVISVLPNLVGFTLGGFAIFIGFGDEKFRQIIVMPDEDASKATIYEGLCATFVHFIVVQLLALLFALVYKGLNFTLNWPLWQKAMSFMTPLSSGIGYLLFIYAVCLALAACLHVFRVAVMYADTVKALTPSDSSDIK